MGTHEPANEAGRLCLEDEGYGYLRPCAVEKVDGTDCRYLSYRVKEGQLLLEVSWTGSGGWKILAWDVELNT